LVGAGSAEAKVGERYMRKSGQTTRGFGTVNREQKSGNQVRYSPKNFL